MFGWNRNTTSKLLILLATLLSLTLLVACQGRSSEDPPIHLNPDMDSQPRYDPQSASDFFIDGSTMRQPVEGTIAYGDLNEDDIYYRGKDEAGKFVKKSPLLTTIKLLERGQERYDIYCSPCHGRVGDGRGIIVNRGYIPPPSYHIDRIRNLPDGELFNIITNGVRNMPSYKHQISVEDRWAIISYVRALQRSQNAPISDVPVENRNNIQ